MVKPQFEVGKGNVGAGGVVRDPALRQSAVAGVAAAAAGLGLGVAGVTPARCRGRRATWSTSCGCAAARPPLDEAALRRGHRGGAAVTRPASRPGAGTSDEGRRVFRRPAGERRLPRERGAASGRTMLLVAHTGRAPRRRIARVVVYRLTGAGVAVRVLEPEAAELGCPSATVVPVSPAAAAGAEMVLVIGGDGTLLQGRGAGPGCRGPVARE